MDNSPGEIRRLIALLLDTDEPSHSVLLAVQHLTNVLICRLDTCALVRANGAALIDRMRHFLQKEQDMHAPSRNDFFYAMMWIFDPAVGASDPNLQVLLSYTGFFVEELLKATQQGSRLYSANILNGLANLVSYVGRRMVEPFFAPHDVLGVISHLLDTQPAIVNRVSASLLFGNYYMDSDVSNLQMVARLQTMIPVIANVIVAAVTDTQFGGRTWSPKGACEALSNLSQYGEFHQALRDCQAEQLLASVLLRDWTQRQNYQTLGAEYYAEAIGYAARSLWNLRFAAPLPASDCVGLAARIGVLLDTLRFSSCLLTCLYALRDAYRAKQPVVDSIEPESMPPCTSNATLAPLIVSEPNPSAATLARIARHCGLPAQHTLPQTHAMPVSSLLDEVRRASCLFALLTPTLLSTQQARIALQLATCLRKPVFLAYQQGPPAINVALAVDDGVGCVLDHAIPFQCA